MTLVMGIVNRTPDSFYDGGRMGLNESLDFASRLVAEGADILDIGGVRAGPGPEVSEAEEISRLLPLAKAAAKEFDVPLSIETARPEVARRVLDAGARYINDVTGLADESLAAVCAEFHASLILMHHGGQIRGRPRNPTYVDVVQEVVGEWERLAGIARTHGVRDENIVVDPGLDFGKNTFHSLELMRRVSELVTAPWPVLIAPSRKDVVGETLDLPSDERLEGTLSLVTLSVAGGAAIVRVHDVAAAVRTVNMTAAVIGMRAPAAPLRGLWE